MKMLSKILVLLCLTGFHLHAQKQVTFTIQIWNGSSWQNNMLGTRSYDANFFLTGITYQSWSSSASTWTNTYSYSYTNNPAGDPTQVSFRIWNASANTWSNSAHTSFAYNAAGKEATVTAQTWNGSSWQNSNQQQSAYDANNFSISRTIKYWSAASSSFTNGALYTFTNDVNGNPVNYAFQTWNSAVNTWSNNQYNTTVFNTANLQVNSTNLIWTNNNWQNGSKILWTYDANNFLLNYTSQNWNTTSSSWVNGGLSTFTNDANGNPLVQLFQTWNSAAATWTNSQKTIYSYINVAPTVSTGMVVNNIGPNTADCSGTVSANGGANVTSRGICFSTNPNPTTADQTSSSGSGNGTYTANLTGLAPNTVYYVRAFATNSVGTSYGALASFTTSSGTGLSMLNRNQAIKVYPSPASEYLFVSVANAPSDRHFKLYNTAGALVLNGLLENNITSIDVRGLPAGIYFLKAGTEAPVRILKN